MVMCGVLSTSSEVFFSVDFIVMLLIRTRYPDVKCLVPKTGLGYLANFENCVFLIDKK